MLYVRNSYSPYPFIGVVFLGWNVYYGDAGAHVPSAPDSFSSSGCFWWRLLCACQEIGLLHLEETEIFF